MAPALASEIPQRSMAGGGLVGFASVPPDSHALKETHFSLH